jgi:O-antigen/teichoic acid export membrane protein
VNDSAKEPVIENPLRRVLGNFGLLLRGRGIGAVLLLGATALMAKALGPAEFGIIVLMQTYTLLIRGLLNFKQSHAIIRFGVPAWDAGDIKTLRRLIHVGRRIDLYAALAATLAAVLLAPLIGPMMGLDSERVTMLAMFSLTLLTSGNVSATGILRLFDQFDTLGRKEIIDPLIRFTGIAIAWWLEAPFVVFLAIFALAYCAENIYVICCGRREYERQLGEAVEGDDFREAKIAEFSGLRDFLWITYWQSNIDLVPKHLSILMAGALLGATEAGLLRLARQFSTVLAKPAVLIRQVVFLDLTRSWNQGSSDFKLIAYRTALVSGGIGLIFVLIGFFFGEYLLGEIIGEEFIGAAPVLTLLLLAASFDLFASSLRSAAYAVGRAGKVLRLSVVSSIVYLTSFVLLTQELGIVGAGIAACAAALIAPLVLARDIHKSTQANPAPATHEAQEIK